MKANKLLRFQGKQKALDAAVWINFSKRTTCERVGVIKGNEDEYYVVPTDDVSIKGHRFEKLPKDYKQMRFEDIKEIRMDREQLSHWEDLFGIISTCHGELLRFILAYNLPLGKMIRYELAARGYDKDHRWVGFKKAEEIWLK